jgi:hypothetical protein
MVLKWPDWGTERVFCSPSVPLPTPGGPRAWGANPMEPHHPTHQRADVSCCQCPGAAAPPLSRELWVYPALEKECDRLLSARRSPQFVETIRILLKQIDLLNLGTQLDLKSHYVRSRVHNLCGCGLYSSLSIGIGYDRLPERRGCCALRISCHARLHMHRPHGLHRLPFRGQE